MRCRYFTAADAAFATTLPEELLCLPRHAAAAAAAAILYFGMKYCRVDATRRAFDAGFRGYDDALD